MRLEFQCPWCGCESSIKGSAEGSWRFRLPCDLCEREMVLTWDGGLVVARAPTAMAREDDATVPIKFKRAL